eukprot:3678325-Amphidinium_carterae.1
MAGKTTFPSFGGTCSLARPRQQTSWQLAPPKSFFFVETKIYFAKPRQDKQKTWQDWRGIAAIA